MKQTFVRTLALLLVLSTVLPMAVSCHGSRAQDPFSMPEVFDTSRTYEITFWAKNDTNKRQANVYEQAIADFEALYPNIDVRIRPYTDYGRIYSDVITNIATNTTPNVCITYPDHVATYLTGRNVMVPLDTLMTDPQWGLGGEALRYDGPTVEEMIPEFLAEGVLDGAQYALPFMRSTEACYINKTYVEALGYEVPDVLTWDFIWEVSEAATAKAEDGTYLVNGQTVLIPFIYKSTDNMTIQYLRQAGAGYSTAEGEVELFNETTKEYLYAIADHTASGAFGTFKTDSYPANYLNAGQCIFAIDSTAGATWMGTDAPLMDIDEDQIVQFETVVRAVPQIDPENPQMISQGPSICIFNKEDPQEVLASWLFAQFLLTDRVQIAYAQTEGYVPVTSKAQEAEEYLDYLMRAGEDDETHYQVKLDATKLLLSHTEDTFVTPVFNGSASLRNAAGQLVENVVKSVRRGETVDDAYLLAQFEKVSTLYHLDEIGAGDVREKEELGPLPTASALLLGTLGAIWCGMGIYVLAKKRKKRG